MRTQSTHRQPARVFLSYASKNDAHRLRFLAAVKPLEREGLLEIRVDRKVLPGEQWSERIAEELAAADIVVPLLSIDFLASDYCHEEISAALSRRQRGEVLLVPVLVEPCHLTGDRLAGIQMLPDRSRAVSQWANPDEAWTAVVAGLRRLVEPWREGQTSAPSDVEAAADPTRYLEYLRTQHSYIELRGMGAQVAERLPLDGVYIRLRAAGGDSAERGSRGKAHDIDGDTAERRGTRELREVLAEHEHIALIGDPGSGKTTFLRFVAQQLARAGLGEIGALERLGLHRAGGPPDFPVFVRIERMASFLEEHPDDRCPHDAPEHFLRYLDYSLEGHRHGLPPSFLRERVGQGGCCVLFDGLDEVAGEAQRQRMSALIENVVVQCTGNRFVLTCRTRAWQGRTAIAQGVTPFRLSRLEPEQIDRFCESWARALFRVASDAGEGPEHDAAMRYRDELLAAVENNPSGDTFTESPLLLTVLAVVHWNERKLPEQRAELYDRAVEYLLESRRDQAGRETLLRKECLQAVAAAMVEHEEGVQRSLGVDEAANAVAEVLGCSAREAATFVEQETLLSGLLVSRTEGEVEFWHLVFEEYLAAVELAQADDRWQRIEANLFSDRWSEVLLLLGGCLCRLRGRRGPRDYLRFILEQGEGPGGRARAVALASRIRRDVLAYGHDPADGTRFEDLLDDTLGLFLPGAEIIEEPVGVEVGEALGEVGDPRLVDEQHDRVSIAGGRLLMGAQDSDADAPGFDADAFSDEAPVHEVTVSAFLAARHPVTVAAYAAFIEARGYDDVEAWGSEGWAWRTRENRTTPDDWVTQRRHGNRPVTGVCWYEAAVFARWWGGALPTEAQWEWMARGAAGRRFPWGDAEPSPAHASYGARLDHATPVGIYPRGLTPEGVADLAGNVWEWCADWYGEYGERAEVDPQGPRRGNARVLRGGAFGSHPHALRAANRTSGEPGRRGGRVGFRVVWSSPEDG